MGETILGNRYEIIRKVGDGGMAFVYEAKDRLLNRTVALKVLRPEFVDDDEFLSKFKREAEAVASLSHPNIVNVYDVGEDGKVHYIVMEFIEGRNLKEIIKNEGILDEYTSLDIIKQIAKALSEAHKKGVIHRDIKPHNILISNEGRIVKVADFGIAKAVSNSTMTNIGSIIGSVHYFSPEQAKGKFVTSNADLYSLGIVLYEMLIGKVPFRGDSPISIALQHINDEIEFTPEERVSIPQSVRTIIKKLTEKSSAERYQSAEEVIEDIEYIEKNIDLDFIKEYDNFATKKIDGSEITKKIDQDDFEDDEYDDEDINKKKKKKKKSKKKDSPKTKKKLTIAAIVLVIILIAQLAFAFKFFVGNKSDVIKVQNLVGMNFEDASKEMEKYDIKLIMSEEYNAKIEKDSIVSQAPQPGTELKKGETIKVVVSKGPKNGEIPSLVGFSLEEAENILKDNKLALGNVKPEYSDVPKGHVISQDPLSGNGSIEEGDKINVIISKGPKPQEKQKEQIEQPPANDNNQNVNPDNKPPDTPNGSNTDDKTQHDPNQGSGAVDQGNQPEGGGQPQIAPGQ